MKRVIISKIIILVFVAISLSLITGCITQQKVISDKAIQAIVEHDKVKAEKIQIFKIENIGNNNWFVFYKIRTENDALIPIKGYLGVNVKKTSSGEYETEFINYASP